MTTSPIEQPSARQLLRVTLLAVAAASLILMAIVLPAEYGVDPLGTGRAVGLMRPPSETTPAAIAPAPATQAAAGPPSPLFKSPTPFRHDEMTITLESGEGMEVKAAMRHGQRLVFSWTTSGGGVDVDMHGEVPGAAADDSISYSKDEGQTSGHGALEAPATGNHGWFWQNLNDGPVRVTVKVSGFYDRLFRP